MSGTSPLAKIKFWADISYRMLRIRTVFVMITFEAIGYEAVKPTTSLSRDFLLASLMLGALYTCATCFNDVADEEIDKVNLPHDVSRPLMTTAATSRQLRRLGIIAMSVSILAAVLISPAYVLIVAGGIVLSVFYSVSPFKISHRGIFASLWLTISYVLLPFLAGSLAHAHLNRLSIEVLIAMYLCFLGRVLLKDFRDYEGDKKFGKLNFLVRHGPAKTSLAAAIAWLAGDLVFVVTLARTFPYITLLMQPIIIAICYGLYRLAKEKDYEHVLIQVLFVGRMGNAVALALLSELTLQAFRYSAPEKHAIVLIVGLFMSISAIYLWRDSADKIERDAKTKRRRH